MKRRKPSTPALPRIIKNRENREQRTTPMRHTKPFFKGLSVTNGTYFRRVLEDCCHDHFLSWRHQCSISVWHSLFVSSLGTYWKKTLVSCKRPILTNFKASLRWQRCWQWPYKRDEGQQLLVAAGPLFPYLRKKSNSLLPRSLLTRQISVVSIMPQQKRIFKHCNPLWRWFAGELERASHRKNWQSLMQQCTAESSLNF